MVLEKKLRATSGAGRERDWPNLLTLLKEPHTPMTKHSIQEPMGAILIQIAKVASYHSKERAKAIKKTRFFLGPSIGGLD